MNPNRRLIAVIVVLLLLAGCAGTTGTKPIGATGTNQPSVEGASAYAINLAYDLYDTEMKALRLLQVQKVITEEKYQILKDKYGWPFYLAVKAADDAAQQYAAAPDADRATFGGKLTTALNAMADSKAKFKKVVDDAKEGMK